jgi:SNF2 family DNA or RNA helicase
VGDLVAAKGFERCHMEILAILMKLRQVCCHLELLKLPELAKAAGPSAKLEQFFEILDEAMDGGHRVLVFSQFVGMLHIIRREMESRGLAYCYLDGQSKDRMAQVQLFNQQHNIPAFLISLKAGGTGLNLTGADMVVHFDPWWNPAVEDQATDRAHRIGQKRTVYSIKLIAEHTVEEKVLALQRRKQAIIGATISSADETIMKAFSWDDVRDLLGL